MDRRTFLQAVAGGAGALYGSRGHGQERSAPTPPVPTPPVPAKPVLSVPLTHSDWMLKPNIPWGLEGVRHMLDACKACGWSHVYWRALDAGRATYASKLLARGLEPEADNFFNPQTDADRQLKRKFFPGQTPEQEKSILAKQSAMDYATFDSLAAAVDYGHKIGLKVHAWASINEDDHGWGWPSEFTKRHPEFRWRRRDGRTYHSQLSFAFEEVRQYKLGVIDELLAYPIDGLFLDWIRTGDVRDNPQTDPQGVADSGYETPLVERFKAQFGLDPHDLPNGDDRWVRTRAEPQTVFMRGVRDKARAKGIPVAAMVGHPWHYRGLLDKIDGSLRGLLLEVATWAKEGLVDAVVAAGYYRDGGTPEKAHAALKEETGGKVDVWTYAWVPRTVAEFARDYDLAKRLAAPRVLLWEADYIDDRPDAGDLKAAMSAAAE
jgi:hypothetical protein